MKTNTALKLVTSIIALSILGFFIFHMTTEKRTWQNEEHGIPINQIELYDAPGKCIGTYRYKVLEPHSDGYALAVELRRLEFAPLDSPTSNTVMIHDPHNHAFYRDEIIKISKDSCARQIGICKLGSSISTLRIIPLVQIMQ